MINFGTLGYIPSSAQKITPSIQRIRRDIDPHVYNQRLQAAERKGLSALVRRARIPASTGKRAGTRS